jgi:hypothetical protein
MNSTTIQFLNDNSWLEEIDEFSDSIINDKKINSGNSQDALQTMKLIYKIYYNDIDWRKEYDILKP